MNSEQPGYSGWGWVVVIVRFSNMGPLWTVTHRGPEKHYTAPHDSRCYRFGLYFTISLRSNMLVDVIISFVEKDFHSLACNASQSHDGRPSYRNFKITRNECFCKLCELQNGAVIWDVNLTELPSQTAQGDRVSNHTVIHMYMYICTTHARMRIMHLTTHDTRELCWTISFAIQSSFSYLKWSELYHKGCTGSICQHIDAPKRQNKINAGLQ